MQAVLGVISALFFEHSAVAGKDQDPGEGNHLQVLLGADPSPFPVGSGSRGLELCCHLMPGAREGFAETRGAGRCF